ncbi:MAG: NUDIX hydrolase [Candidatus Caenarcaniphilales bacterium]|nr:NUDIX hydrolase [Candidatus Caenarcaniphilales bacterium]
MTADAINAPTIRVSLVIINEKQEILLVKHKKKNREYWVLPGGHLEFGETVEECALRELKEETNLDGEFVKTIAISESIAPDGSRHIMNIFTLVTVKDGSIKICSDEDIIMEVAYLPLSKLASEVVYPDVKDFILDGYKNNWSFEGLKELKTPWS